MPDAPVLTIHTDGAARGNPGPAAFAYVIQRDGQPPVEHAARMGNTTNNQAEYTALVRALDHALRLGPDHRVTIHSDSELMVKQMRGEYRVKDAGLKPLYEEACRLRDRFAHPVRFVHVRREYNSRADELCNFALDGGGTISSSPPPSAALESVDDRAIAILREAAAAWARGKADEPDPAAVWRRLRKLIHDG